MYQDAAVIALIATVRSERKLSGSHVPCADGAGILQEFSNVRFSQALHQAVVARLTENQTQKLSATADAEMKVMIVPGTKFT